MKLEISSRAVILQGENMLVVGQKNLYCLPWGKLDAGESTEECLIREIEEELDFTAEDLKLIAIQQLIKWDTHRFDFIYLVGNSEDFDLDDAKDASHSHELNNVTRVNIYNPEVEILPYDIVEILQEWNLETVYKFTNTVDA